MQLINSNSLQPSLSNSRLCLQVCKNWPNFDKCEFDKKNYFEGIIYQKV